MREEWNKYVATVKDNIILEYGNIKKIKVGLGKEKWVGGIFKDGHIYGITNCSKTILKINTEKLTCSEFGDLKAGEFKWTGGCVFENNIYGFSRRENSLLKINTKKNKAEVKKLDIAYDREHHYAGVMTSEGIIYQPPRDTNTILKINLSSFEIKEIRLPENLGNIRIIGSVIHPNGKIYFLPEGEGKVLEFTPETEEILMFNEKINPMVYSACVGIDENIYGFSLNNGILKIDVNKKKTIMLHDDIYMGCYGSAVGINGNIYGVPGSGNAIYEFHVHDQSIKKIYEISENVNVKCAGSAISDYGDIFMIPAGGEYVYIIEADKEKEVLRNYSAYNPYFSNNY